MKVGLLTAALQELTPREVRDADPDRAIEEWIDFAREIGASHIQLSAALHPTETDVPADAMLDRWPHARLRQPFDNDRASGSSRRSSQRRRRPTSRISTTCCTTTRRSAGRSATSCGVCSAPRRSMASTRYLRRPQPAARHGRKPCRLRKQFLSCRCEGGEGERATTATVPMPGWTPQTTGTTTSPTPRHLDRAASPCATSTRRRSVNSLRPVPRHPDGAGHPVDLPVSERHRLQLPDRRLSCRGQVIDAKGLAAWNTAADRGRARELGRRQAVAAADQVNAWKKQVVFSGTAPGHPARSPGVPCKPDGRLVRPSARGA
jgi:hypothetical protein